MSMTETLSQLDAGYEYKTCRECRLNFLQANNNSSTKHHVLKLDNLCQLSVLFVPAQGIHSL